MSETTENTKEALIEHRSLPLLRRIGRRAVGNYPTRHEREALRREEIGATGRIFEDALSAVRYSQKLNKTPNAVLGGTWITASMHGNSARACIPITDADRPGCAAKIEDIFKLHPGRRATTKDMDGFGFIVPNYSRLKTPKDAASELPEISLVAMRDYNVVDTIVLTRTTLDLLSAEQLVALEEAASLANTVAYTEWMMYKPERID